MDYDKQIAMLNAQKKEIQEKAERQKKNLDLQINYLRRKKLDQQRQEIQQRKTGGY